MKPIIFSLLLLSVLACKKPEDETVTPQEPSLVGTWVTSSLQIKAYENNVLKQDTTVYAPYKNLVDVIETIRFTSDSAYLKHINESKESSGIKYKKNGDVILITYGTAADTLFLISALNTTDLNFNYGEKENDQPGQPHRYADYFYKSKRK